MTEKLTEAVESGDQRRSLVAIRNYLANELEGNRCPKCKASQLRTGDTAALVLRLTKVIEELAALGPEAKGDNVSEIEKIRRRRRGLGA